MQTDFQQIARLPMNQIDHSLNSVDAYVEFFTHATLPVLRHTLTELNKLRESSATISARQVAGVVLGDPLMTLKVLIDIENRRGQRQNHDITTIDRAIMMVGLLPFFDRFTSNTPTLEQTMGGVARPLLGIMKVITRARRAAHFARDWAILRHDLDVEEITVAALLFESAEILCWTFASGLMQQIAELQAKNRGLRSVVAQRAVLGVTLEELQMALVRAWRLPSLLVDMMDPEHAENPRVRNVLLANDLARHLANGWDDPALPDDLQAIGQLLRVSRENLLTRIGMPEEFRPRYLPPLED